MSYQVIARKWRPNTFDEVTGQEAITRTLGNALEHDRLHHAYMFSGARGVGKTTTARLLAKGLNCHSFDKSTAKPCDKCASCREIAAGNSLDTLEFDAASNTGIDKIRDLVLENIEIAPARDRYKVFIIDEIHMLSDKAFNALLKTLEEPPPRVVFIMATTELHKVPDTILSRCQQFEFRIIALNKIIERLKIIADAEKIAVAPDALREIARAGNGSMRDAQSAFDQVISFSGAKIEMTDVTNALGIAGTDLLIKIVGAIAEQKPLDALKVVEELISRGQDLRNFCRDLLAFLRDLLVAKIAGDAGGLLESAALNPDELQKYAANFSETDLTRFFHSLSDTETKLRDAVQSRYVLEIGLVKLIEMRRVAPLEKVLERLAKLENILQNGGDLANNSSENKTKSSASVEPVKPVANLQVAPRQPEKVEPAKIAVEPIQPEKIERIEPENIEIENIGVSVESSPVEIKNDSRISAENGDDVRNLIQTEIERRNLMWLSISIEKAETVKITENTLTLEFAPPNKQYQATWETTENTLLMREVCQKLFNRRVEINSILQTSNAVSNAAEPKRGENPARSELWKIAEADPTVQMVLKTFRGKIVSVQKIEDNLENSN